MDLTIENFEGEIELGVTLVDFWATWCGPCLMQGKILEEATPALEAINVKIGKVNVDEQPDLAARFGITSIPTLLIFKNGELKKQVVGVHNFVAIKQMLDEVF